MRWTAQAGNGAGVGFSKEQRWIWMAEQTETVQSLYWDRFDYGGQKHPA